MKGLFTSTRTAELEVEACKFLHCTSLQLMDRAVDALFQEMKSYLPRPQAGSVAVLIGPGNNGGDGLGLARRWRDEGFSIQLFGVSEGRSPEWTTQQSRIAETPRPLSEFRTNGVGLVIDAYFGAGFRGELPEELQALSQTLQVSRTEVWAVDCPTGLDGNRAFAAKGTFHAHRTFCIGTEKYAVHHPASQPYVGQVHFVDIGLNQAEPDLYLLDGAWVAERLPPRQKTEHKGSGGKLQVVGGYRGLTGAGILSALAAFKAGCGYVFVETDARDEFLRALPEVVLQKGEGITAVVLGPGLGRESEKTAIVREWLQTELPLVVDGDALFHLSQLPTELWIERPKTVLTPHPQEMARLLNNEMSASKIQEDRLAIVREARSRWKSVLVLKGAGTLVSDSSSITLNPTGNEGMATAGQGDCLSGVIGALLAAGVPASDAARMGVYLHGMAGDACARHSAAQGVLAHEVAQRLPSVFEHWRRFSS